MECKHINSVKANMNGSYMGYLCKDCGNLIYKEEQQMRDDNICIGKDVDKIVPHLGRGNIVITATDDRENIRLDKPMTIGNNNESTSNSIVIGYNNRVIENNRGELNNMMNELRMLIEGEKKEVKDEFKRIEEELKKQKPNEGIIKKYLENMNSITGIGSNLLSLSLNIINALSK